MRGVGAGHPHLHPSSREGCQVGAGIKYALDGGGAGQQAQKVRPDERAAGRGRGLQAWSDLMGMGSGWAGEQVQEAVYQLLRQGVGDGLSCAYSAWSTRGGSAAMVRESAPFQGDGVA